jgi:nitrate reductase molybdenum cofactor assembly chaperone NarJ/NarW
MRSSPTTMSRTLRSLAYLLSYPTSDLKERQKELIAVQESLANEQAIVPTRLQEIDGLIVSMGQASALQLEAEYVQTFDTRRNQSLHLFEHVHGDSRDRGPAMIDLTQTYIQKGLFLHDGELPDYLPVVLEFASLLSWDEAQAFLAEFSHLLTLLYSALTGQKSRYACLLAALLDLAGEPVTTEAVQPEPPVDQSWEEPVAFDGCTNQGQQEPGRPQVIQIVRPQQAQGALA